MRETIRPLGENKFSYEMDLRQKTGEAPREVALAVALDPALYFDGPIRVDGRELRFDRNYNASDWHSSEESTSWNYRRNPGSLPLKAGSA